MTDLEPRKVAKEFAERWKDKGYEKGESQKFWIDLLENVLEVKNASTFINFEDTVHIDKATGFIDGFIPSTKVLIEQKSIEKDLRKAIKQSDGSLLNPFQQAKRYSVELPYDDRPRWIVTCNFKSFLVYDMNNPNGEPEEILLKDLSKEYYRLSFLVDSKKDHIKKEEEISFKAGEIVGVLYDAFSKQYNDLSQESSQKSLNELCVRLVFCLYAEDAGLFGRKNVFHDYLAKYEDLDQMRKALIELFKILDTPTEERDQYLEDDLNQFPYVNGDLFSNESIEIPRFTQEIRDTLLAKASDDFDWSDISPTIFGAVFESTLNPETRRAGGMHYTSIENIHKVIDPLFLDELRKELDDALAYKNEKTRNEALDKFQEHIGSLTFFDPACGSGNFLTETYLSLRRMENEAIAAKQHGMIALDFGDVVKVHINQFYGIEINDFAVKVATTALWIAESQMLQETERLLSRHLEFLPLKTYTNIVEGNALRIDWNDVISNNDCDYIMGNPPFVGTKLMSDEQREDRLLIFNSDDYGKLDYVSCWYKKAADYMKNTQIKSALVSTNSISQGEQTALLWKLLFEMGIYINFAYRTFRWDSEASIKAHVHCVIIGFSYINETEKYIYDSGRMIKAKNISGYLVDAPNIFIEKTQKSLFGAKEMTKGSQLIDGGYFVFTPEEKDKFVKQYPESQPYFYEYINADSFLNNREQKYCLCLKDCPSSTIKNNRGLYEIVNNVYNYRANSDAASTYKLKDKPTEFFITNIPKGNSLLIPVVSSERRKYIPLGFIKEKCIYTNATNYVDNATLFDFGLFISNVHMAWMRVVAGRLKSDYRYSKDLVYNTFPIPQMTQEQKESIEKTAKLILDIRTQHKDSSLADLYDELTMPSDLRKAHQLNDKAVMEAYGFPVKTSFTESDCVAKLMQMYQDRLSKDK
ncbi:MAG: class I SAM-dependent DNA methyltransferase [Bacilli bacterium]|nr:class I SAM-dependent DNA methyltransferase [Bacilli bacterium]